MLGTTTGDDDRGLIRRRVPADIKPDVPFSSSAADASTTTTSSPTGVGSPTGEHSPTIERKPPVVKKRRHRVFGMEEVEQHNTAASAWAIYEGKVYDITPYIASGVHPGGNAFLLQYAGSDLTEAFQEVGHSKAALRQLLQFFIGYLEGQVPDHPEDDIGAEEQVEDNDTGVVEPEFRHDRDCVMDGVDFRLPLFRQIYNTTKDQYVSLTSKFFCSTCISDFFENPILEFLSRTAWWVIPLLWLPVAFTLFIHTVWTYKVSVGASTSLFFGGVLSWTFAEYNIHRFLFHFPESRLPDSGAVRVIHFLGHGVHHLLPMDPMRLVMPPALLVILMAPFYVVLSSSLPMWFFRCFWSGVLAGYVAYDMIHYASHYFAVDNLPYLRFMKRYHMKHHYREPLKAFGVSSPLWDYIFGTPLA